MSTLEGDIATFVNRALVHKIRKESLVGRTGQLWKIAGALAGGVCALVLQRGCCSLGCIGQSNAQQWTAGDGNS